MYDGNFYFVNFTHSKMLWFYWAHRKIGFSPFLRVFGFYVFCKKDSIFLDGFRWDYFWWWCEAVIKFSGFSVSIWILFVKFKETLCAALFLCYFWNHLQSSNNIAHQFSSIQSNLFGSVNFSQAWFCTCFQ